MAPILELRALKAFYGQSEVLHGIDVAVEDVFARPTIAELADLMEARVFMERDLASLAAERATPEELAHIEGTIVMMAEKIVLGESVLEALNETASLITKVVAKQKNRGAARRVPRAKAKHET